MDRARESYGRLHPRLWRTLLVLCGDPAMADDVQVETFASIVRSVSDDDREDEPEELDARVWRTAVERAAAARAERQAAVMAGEGPLSITMVDAGAPVLADITAPLQELSDLQRAIVALRDVAAMGPRRMSDVLAVGEDAIAAESGAGASPLTDRQIERIEEFEPPDLWPRILVEVSPPAAVRPVRGGARKMAPRMALIAIAAAGLFWLANPTGGSTPPAAVAESATGERDAEPDDADEAPPPVRDPALGRPAGRAEPLVLSAVEDRAAIYGLRLPSGERFRLSVPARLHNELDTVFLQTPPGVIHVTGPEGTEVRITFTHCTDQDGMTENLRGSLIRRLDDPPTSITFCRPDELLVTTVTTDIELNDAQLQTFDVRPVELAAAYARHRSLLIGAPTFGGPVRFDSVIVNATGPDRITAIDTDNLSELWTHTSTPGRNGDVHLLAPSVGDGSETTSALHADGEGVWVAESGNGITNLDPGTGRSRWRLDVPGRPGGIRGAPGAPWFVWSSFTGEGDDRPPALQRVDPDTGEVLWRADGRAGADWGWNPFAATDDQVFIADVFDDPDRSAAGEGSVIHAFDVESGALDFTVALDAPEGALWDARLLEVVSLGEETVLLSKTTHGLLSLIDLPEGRIRWSRPVNPGVLLGTARTTDGIWTLRVQASPSAPYYLDVRTGQRLADVTLPVPPPECVAQYGRLARVDLRPAADPTDGTGPESDPDRVTSPPDCVIVAESQHLRLANEGFWPMTLTWTDRREEVAPGDRLDLDPVGQVFPIGPTRVAVEPYADLTVWVMAADAGPTAGLRRTEDSFGPVEVGMTAADASEALGLAVELIAFDTSSGCLVVSGDPYSPIFRTDAAADGLVIADIGLDCLR